MIASTELVLSKILRGTVYSSKEPSGSDTSEVEVEIRVSLDMYVNDSKVEDIVDVLTAALTVVEIAVVVRVLNVVTMCDSEVEVMDVAVVGVGVGAAAGTVP